MNKKFGDKMEVGDKVVIRTWAYAVSTKRVQCSAALMKDGAKGQIERVVDRNAVIVRYRNGLVAPVHPSAVYPEI